MAAKYHYEPDYAVSPGDVLEDTLEARNIRKNDLALRTGLTPKTINQILRGIAPVTSETAIKLERALGLPAQTWVNLEAEYRLQLARITEKERLVNDIEWSKRFPIRKLINRGFMQDTPDPVEKVQGLLNFFGVSSSDAWKAKYLNLNVSFRKSAVFDSEPESMTSWIRIGEIEAEKIDCNSYNEVLFADNIQKMRELTTEAPEVFEPELYKLCRDAGVALTLNPELPKIHLSGLSRWLAPDKALIMLSLRHKTDDQFWFSLFHECAHVMLHSKRHKKKIFIDYQDQSDGDLEEEANRFSANLLIPPEKYDFFVEHTVQFNKSAILKFAAEINIAPGIVAGRLQRERKLPFSHCNDLKNKFDFC